MYIPGRFRTASIAVSSTKQPYHCRSFATRQRNLTHRCDRVALLNTEDQMRTYTKSPGRPLMPLPGGAIQLAIFAGS